MSVLSDRDIRAAIEAGEVVIRPYDPAGPAAVVGRPPPRPPLPGLPQQPLRRTSTSGSPQPDLTEMLSVADDEPFILHPGEFVLGQTLEWVELPNNLVARLGGQVEPGEARPADPFDGRLRRPGLEGQPDARAVERREPPDRPVLRHEDRADQLLPDVAARSIGRTAARSSAPSTRASRSRRPRPSTATSRTARTPREPAGAGRAGEPPAQRVARAS